MLSPSVLYIEWCKSHVHARCWSEVTLLLEEMRKVCTFLEWQVGWWDCQVWRWDGLDYVQKEALMAYAQRQVWIRCDMRAHFATQWAYTQEYAKMGMDGEGDEGSMDAPVMAGVESTIHD